MNQRPLGPEPSALPNCATPRNSTLGIIAHFGVLVNSFFAFFRFFAKNKSKDSKGFQRNATGKIAVAFLFLFPFSFYLYALRLALCALRLALCALRFAPYALRFFCALILSLCLRISLPSLRRSLEIRKANPRGNEFLRQKRR